MSLHGRNFLSAAEVALCGAVGADDPFLFDAVIRDIDAFPSLYGIPEADLAVEIVKTVVLWGPHGRKNVHNLCRGCL